MRKNKKLFEDLNSEKIRAYSPRTIRIIPKSLTSYINYPSKDSRNTVWENTLREYEPTGVLRKGNDYLLTSVMHKFLGGKYIIKIFEKDNNTFERVLREYEIGRTACDKKLNFLMKTYDFIEDEKYFYILGEFIWGKTLKEKVQKYWKNDPVLMRDAVQFCKKMVVRTVDCIEKLHVYGYCHQNMNIDHVMIEKDTDRLRLVGLQFVRHYPFSNLPEIYGRKLIVDPLIKRQCKCFKVLSETVRYILTRDGDTKLRNAYEWSFIENLEHGGITDSASLLKHPFMQPKVYDKLAGVYNCTLSSNSAVTTSIQRTIPTIESKDKYIKSFAITKSD